MATTKTRRSRKLTPEQIEKIRVRNENLAVIQQAIAEGRAYLDTYCGRRKVIGYRDDTGDCYTNNTGRDTDGRTFMVCLESILID